MSEQQAEKQGTPTASEIVGALENVLASVLEKTQRNVTEAEKIRAAADSARRDSDLLSSIKLGPEGLEATDVAALWRLANLYARSDIVPEHYRAKPENCLIALQMAQRCRLDPFAFMQSSYIVHGRPGIEGKLAIAMLNASGKIKGRVRFALSGQGGAQQCTASVTDRETGEEISLTLLWQTVELEGWHLPKGKGEFKQKSKWETMPDQMFRYRSATFLIRAHYPEVLMGLKIVEELEDEEPSVVARRVDPNGETPAPSRTEATAAKLQERARVVTVADPEPSPAPAPPVELLSDHQYAQIVSALRESGVNGQQLVAAFGLPVLNRMPAARFSEAMAWISDRWTDKPKPAATPAAPPKAETTAAKALGRRTAADI